jgi:2-polyprenyl-3-methyl-5-hydroxy-6-metoxy-1,4-benzoquinol methylase
MNPDSVNNEFYNSHAAAFDKIPFGDVLTTLISKYVTKPRSQILEIGSGPGALALWMTQQGHAVTCIEPAEKPAKLARKKGLTVYTVKFQDYRTDQQFDYIFAISSLIHISRLEMPAQIKKISELLEENGHAIVSFMEGATDSFEDPTHTGNMRFFSKFSEVELKELLSPYFSIVEFRKIEGKRIHQSFFLLVLKPK